MLRFLPHFAKKPRGNRGEPPPLVTRPPHLVNVTRGGGRRRPWRHGCSIDGQQLRSPTRTSGSRRSSPATATCSCGSRASSPVRRRRPGRGPARARDLHAPRRLARPRDRARVAQGRRQARGARRTPRPAGVAGEDVDLDAHPAAEQRSVEERFESSERVERSAEVMRRLKRDEARALMLKAEGLSYNEIGERLGWTYTKVNRCITEGRRRFMRLYEELETGVECERLAPTLHALAYGTADSEALLELRPHLRNCAGCRATVRALHASRLPKLTAFAPIAALLEPARVWVERLRGGRGAERAGGGRAAPDRAPAAGRGAVAPAQQRRAGRPVRRARGRRERRAALDGPAQPPQLGRDRAPAPPELRPRARRARGEHRRRRPHHLDRGPDRDLRQRRGRGDLLRRDGAPPGSEAGDPERGEGRQAQGNT